MYCISADFLYDKKINCRIAKKVLTFFESHVIARKVNED